MIVPVVIAARNEATAIGSCLDALQASVAWAAARSPLRFELCVVLDDCSDDTGSIAASRGVAVRVSTGGKVAAQRAGFRPGELCIFCDADVAVTPPTLHALVSTLLADPLLRVVVPRKRPLQPRSRTPLARALYQYNLRAGYAARGAWFSGRLFAMRGWSLPSAVELGRRAARHAPDSFYALERGLIADDVYLSRAVVAAAGPAAIAEAPDALLYFHPPETWRGMYRYYRRMRREIERVDLLFPELRPAGEKRRVDRERLARVSFVERRHYDVFRAGLLACQAVYRAERLYRRQLELPCVDWPPILETKRPFDYAQLE